LIQITKLSPGYIVHATPPDVAVEWQSTEPMTAHALIEQLLKRGAHQTDIGDALYSADPHWLDAPN
jgi:hypothetical protein